MNQSSLAEALDDAPPASAGGKKKKRGKNVNNASNIDAEKIAADFNTTFKAELEKVKTDWDAEK
jgi:hypothetical protein